MEMHPQKFKFTRFDGQSFDLDCVCCRTCKNFFWIQNGTIELPSFCAYCGVKVKTQIVSNEEMSKKQILPE